MQYSNILDSKNIRFALSNVIFHKNKEHYVLKEWRLEKYQKFKVHYLDFHYKNCNYQTKKAESSEVLVTNYQGDNDDLWLFWQYYENYFIISVFKGFVMTYSNIFFETPPTLEFIKKLGLEKTDSNLDKLLELFYRYTEIDIRREITSSIGRQKDNDRIYEFLNKEAFEKHYMEVIYQMFRTTLYKAKDDKRFATLRDRILKHYDNEVMQKMLEYYNFKQQKRQKQKEVERQIIKPSLLIGDNRLSLNKIKDNQISLIFTSPPYYNARIYSDYVSYKAYLKAMQETLKQCYRILEDGRFIIINVSPVITKRAGREFESIRYPIHFDFHQILCESRFYFIDEILWIKPEYSVPNRVAGYLQTKMPLSYKPNCISESLMVYRKNSPFLLDKNIKKYDKSLKNDDELDSTNCWYISPKADKNHPAVFPEELCKRVLKYYSNTILILFF